MIKKLIQYMFFLSAALVILIIYNDIPVNSLPLYTAREGRVCDNCHVNPYKTQKQDEWPNPSIPERKCNMSCQSCHISPGGGGLRNVGGRFFARSTLPMFGAVDRPWHDRNRDFGHLFNAVGDIKEGKQGDKDDVKKFNPKPKRDIQDYHKPHGFYGYDYLAWGYPLNADTIESQSPYAFARERYGNMNADPFFSLGFDIRPTLLATRNKVTGFPMQFDLGGAIHPIEHLTFSATGGITSKKSGFGDTVGVQLQNAFVLLHELPLMTYAQAGIFLPSYGVRHDDHTAPGRRFVEMDLSQDRNLVLGAEVGLAPNYPYFTFAVFKNRTQQDSYSFTGTGASVTAGWRDLAWGVGVSALTKNRDIQDRGNLRVVGLNGYFNLGRLNLNHPLVFQWEVNLGKHQQTVATMNSFVTTYVELDYLLVNGLNIKLAHHFYYDGLKSKIDSFQRIIPGIDWTIFYQMKLSTEVRFNMETVRGNSVDYLLFFHLYY